MLLSYLNIKVINMEMQEPKLKEEHAVVLDYLPNGYSFDNRPIHKKTSIAQVIGKENFTLLEVVPKKDIFLQPHDEIYIGDGKRDQIHHISGKLTMEKLTGTARKEVEFVIQDIVKKNQPRFIQFFNKAQPLTTRMHQLELLPGLGKKHMWQIIEERKVELFKDFEDLKKRVKLIPDPEKIIFKRILAEMGGNEKHYLFVEKEKPMQMM
jgi:putative nucleotide binding protein